MKTSGETYLTFSIDEKPFAIPLQHIKRVVRAVSATTVPESSKKLHGVINFEGTIVPLINLRECLGLPSKDISVSDSFLILNTPQRLLAVTVDAVNKLYDISEDELSNIEIPARRNNNKSSSTITLKHHRVYGDEEGIIVIYDIEGLLNAEMTLQIDQLLDDFLKTNKGGR